MSSLPATTARRPRAAILSISWSAALAAVLSVAIVVAQYLANHEYPFGPKSRNYDDYFAQFVPDYAMFRHLLHGHPAIDLQFNWFVGLGQPFLADYAVYLGGPWTFLIALFPAAGVEIGIFVVTLAKVATIAAAMVVYLRIAHGAGNPWLAALVGTAYATSGFVLEEGLFNPMWLGGVAALPLIALVGHWSRSGRHTVLSVVLIGVLYWSNFYSAVLATVGAAYLTLVMDLVDRVSLRAAAVQWGRFVVRGVLGVGLSLPVVLPGVLGGLNSPALTKSFGPADVRLSTYLGKLFSLTENLDYSPGVSIGTVLLIAALAFFAARAVPVRERLVFGGALILMLVTMAWSTTRIVWNGFVAPHGSNFRSSFVISAFLLVIAWRFLLRPGRRWWPVATGGTAVLLVLAGLTVIGRRSRHDPLSAKLTLVMVAITVLGAAVVALRPATRRVVGAVLAAALVLELAGNAAVVERLRSQPRSAVDVWAPSARQDLALVAQNRAAGRGWPPYRVDAAMYWYGNQSALLGEPGVRYYSSTFSQASARIFADLGLPSSANGREMGSVEDVPLFQLLSVSARLDHWGQGGAPRLTTYDSFPLVRIARPARPAPEVAPVFAHRDVLWDEQVYSAPVWTARPAGDRTDLATDRSIRLAGSCPVGGLLQAVVRPEKEDIIFRSAGTPSSEVRAHLGPEPDGVRLAPVSLPTGQDGRFALDVSASAPQSMDLTGFACFDAARAGRMVAQAQREAPRVEVSGRHLTATWPGRVSGDVIVSTTAVDGWSCTVDGAPATIVPREGLLSVPVRGATQLRCTYATPRLGVGIAAGAVSAVLVALLAVIGWRGRRRRPTGDSTP